MGGRSDCFDQVKRARSIECKLTDINRLCLFLSQAPVENVETLLRRIVHARRGARHTKSTLGVPLPGVPEGLIHCELPDKAVPAEEGAVNGSSNAEMDGGQEGVSSRGR